MFGSINNYGGAYNRPTRQNPDEYAKTYAQQNGLSIEDAKAELKAQYGDPVKDASGSVFNFNNEPATGNTNLSDFFDNPVPEENSIENLINSILNSIMNFLNGNNKTNNIKNAGELETTKMGDGPQKEGDPQPHLNNNQKTETIESEKVSTPAISGKPIEIKKEPSATEEQSVPSKPSAPEERPVVEGKEKPAEPSVPEEPKEPSEPSAPEERPVVEGKEKPQKPEKPSRPPRQ